MAGARSFEPTPRRLREARREGRTPRSPSFVAAGTLLAGALALGASAEGLFEALLEIFRSLLALPSGSPGELLLGALAPLAPALAPVALALVLAPIALSVAHLGPIWAPIGGAGRASSSWPPLLTEEGALDGAAAAARALLALLLSLGVLLSLLRAHLPGILGGAHAPAAMLRRAALSLGPRALLSLAAGLLLLGLADLLYRRWAHRRALRMTPQEIRRDQKESEGDPRSRASIRKKIGEIGWAQLELELAEASLLLYAPGICAAAVELREGRPPRLRASARGALAERLRARARARGLPDLVRPELAARLAALPQGSPLPEALYPALARALRDAGGRRR